MPRSLALRRASLLPLLALLLTSCDTTAPLPPVPISFTAVVQLLSLEGPDTYILHRADANTSYYPLNLPTEFRTEGVAVQVEGYLVRDYRVLLFEVVEIRSIVVLD
jgi:hypothetical protein